VYDPWESLRLVLLIGDVVISAGEISMGMHLSRKMSTMEMKEWLKYYPSRRKTKLTGNTVITQHCLYMRLGKDIGGGVKILLGPEEANPYPPDDYGDSFLSYTALEGEGAVKMLLGREEVDLKKVDNRS